MRLVNTCGEYVQAGWFVHKTAVRRTHAVVVVRAEFRLVPEGAAQPLDQAGEPLSADVPFPGAEDLRYASDLVPFKPHADVLVVAAAYPPDGRPAPACQVSLRAGPVSKTLMVFGDRWWSGSDDMGWRTSEPAPFTRMELRWTRAFGGKDDPRNPLGTGEAPVQGEDGAFRWTRPNVEHPAAPTARPDDRPPPAGFAPRGLGWEGRRMGGTFDERWQAAQWPGEPDDFDWTVYNAAPVDQQVTGYLKGDEALEFGNMHPAHPLYRCRLPGLRMRAILRELDNLDDAGRIAAADEVLPAGYRDVPLTLDTLWADVDAERLVLVWRGQALMRTTKLREATHLLVAGEPLAAPMIPLAAHARLLEQRLIDEAQAFKVTPPAPEPPSPDAPPETPAPALDPALVEAFAEAKAGLDEGLAKVPEKGRAALQSIKDVVARGAAFDGNLAALPRVEGQQASAMQEQIKAMAATLRQETGNRSVNTGGVDQLKGLADAMEQLTPVASQSIFASLQDLGERLKTAEDEAEEKTAALPPPSRQTVERAVAEKASLAGLELCGLDLSGLDLSGLDLTGADLTETDLTGCRLRGSWLAAARLVRTNLAEADLSGAVIIDCNFTEAASLPKRFAGCLVEGANFTGLCLVGMDFSACFGAYAVFNRADVSRADFRRANLPYADFDQATAADADFRHARLAHADFSGSKASRVRMMDADVTNLRANDRADFSGADLSGASGEKTAWELCNLSGARFVRVRLPRAEFPGAVLDGADFDRAHLQQANFDGARLTGTLLTNANLLRCSFDRADLTNAKVCGANCYEAGFAEAVIDGTEFTGSFVSETLLVPR
jgi:uncharacterized protein YjbI with pentapeptide repeats